MARSREPDGSRFAKMVLQAIMNAAINKTMWRLPLWLVIAIGVLAGGAMYYWGLY
jgi:hypothetical protein